MAAAVFASFAMVACGTDNGSSEDKKYEAGYKIVLDEPLEFGAEIDYAAEISLPGAVVKDKNGEIVSYDIEYRITDSENKTISSEYSSFALKPGEYTVTYYYSSMLSLDIKFKVVDRVAPAISFRNVPNDLFVGADKNGFLPLVDIDDASAVETEVKLEFATFGGEKHEVEYSKMADSFAVTEPGVFTFTVTATDASGNKTTESVTWLAKDPGWTDSALEDGLYSDFGEEAYLNTVKAGEVNKYWTVSDYTQGWLENYEGASGVLKLGLSFTDTQNTSVAVKLAKPIKWSDLKGKYILARVYVEGDGLENYFGFAGNQKIQFADELSAATEKKSPLVTGKWTTYALDCDRAVALRMYSDENDDKDNPSSDIKQIQFCFTRSDKSLARMYLYLDGISVAEKLPAAENVKVENGVLAWNAVENASGYRVNVNGTETVTDKTQITLTETKGYAFVTALGNEKTYTESDKSFAVFGLEAKDGEYASFDDPLYEYFVGDDVKVGSETAGYKPTSVSVKYDETNRKLTATVGKGGWGICTALAMRFPRKVDVSEVKTIALGMTADVAGMCNEIAVYDYDYTKQLGKIVIEEGVTRYFIDVSEIDELGGLQFVYQNKIDGNLQDMGENKLTLTFDYVAPVITLPTPVIAVDDESGTVTWDAVENATGYNVTVNGEVHFTETTSYALPEGSGTVKVRAVGDDKTYFDSGEAFAIFGLKAKDGEYASFDSELYGYLVTGDVKVGDETIGYIPASVVNKYEDGRFTTVVGRGNWGICTAVAVRFPHKVNLTGVKHLVLGMSATIESESQTLRVWSLENRFSLGEITVENGKKRYVLDITGNEVGEITGIEFIYLNSADMGDRKITFDFDFIAPAVELGAPEVTVDNASKTISWNAVENAVSYAIVKDGETIGRTTELSYDCSDTGEFTTLGVMAEGTGRFLSGAVGYAEITLDGTDWIEVKGMLTVAKIAWATKDLIQLEFSSGTEYAANAALKAERFALTINGKEFTVTGVVTTDVSTKIVVNGDFSALKKGDVLVVGAKTTLSANGVVYGLTGSYTAIFAGEAGDGYGTYNWCAFAGELSLAKTDWSSAGVIQIVFNTIKEADQTIFDASGITAYANGSAMSFTEIKWHQSVNKLALSFGQPGADATYGVPVITIKGGSVITAAGRAYVFDKDYMFAYSSVHDRWSLVSSPETVSLSWPENSSSLQLKFDRDLWDGEMTVDASRMNVLSNGVKVDVTALKDSPAHIRVQGAFSTQTAEGYDVPTLVIKAGSLAMLHNTSVLFAEDVTFVWNGTAWTMA